MEICLKEPMFLKTLSTLIPEFLEFPGFGLTNAPEVQPQSLFFEDFAQQTPGRGGTMTIATNRLKETRQSSP